MINANDTKAEHEKIMKLLEEWARSGASKEISFSDWLAKQEAR
jgi:hypothetical protein